MIKVTDKALAKLKSLCAQENNYTLRVQVVGGGCSGMSYKMDFDSDPANEKDTTLKFDEVTLLVDAKSALFINGVTLTYTDGLSGTGFGWENPNAKRSCGCGSSFSV